MIKAVITDDEEDARVSLELLLKKFCPDVEIIAICKGPLEALEFLKEQTPDLLFLDVQMPHMSGFDMLEKIEKASFQTIFVTAHDKYAIKAIRFSALDYLLKPVDVDELLSAVERVRESKGKEQDSSGLDSVLHNVKNRLGTQGKLAIPHSKGMDFINLQDLIYCRAEGSYTRIYLDGKEPLLASKGLKEFANILDPKAYCRVHHSCMISLEHVQQYIQGEGGYVIMSNGDHVDIARRRKEDFMKLISRI